MIWPRVNITPAESWLMVCAAISGASSASTMSSGTATRSRCRTQRQGIRAPVPRTAEQ